MKEAVCGCPIAHGHCDVVPFSVPGKGTSRMSILRNIPIARKFLLAFGLVCLLCLGLGPYSLFTFRGIAASSEDVSLNGFPAVAALSEARGGLNSFARADLILLLCQSAECTNKENANRAKQLERMQKALKVYEPTISYPGERETYDKFSDALARYKDVSDRSSALLVSGKTGDALDLLTSNESETAFENSARTLAEDIDLNVKYGLQSSEDTTSVSHRAQWINLGATALIVALCALVGFILNRLIAPRVETGTAALERFAAKDLTVDVVITGTDEIGRLGVALNSCVRSIREVVEAVARGTETLSAATTEISARAVQTVGNAK